jgi:protein-disulfide isomerase
MSRTLRPLAVLVAAAALLGACGQPAGADYLPSSAPTGGAAQGAASGAASESNSIEAIVASLSEETMSVKGAADAPVLMIEFSDYECPFCNRYVTSTLPRIREQYIDTGKLRYVYRDLPLNSIHPKAQAAAEAARCAGDQSKYWEMHDQLFGRQAEWQGGDEQALFGAMAGELGLDTQAFNACLAEGRYTEYVQRQTDEGLQIGIAGTPAFIIGDQFLSGAQPFEVFQQVIERQLAR